MRDQGTAARQEPEPASVLGAAAAEPGNSVLDHAEAVAWSMALEGQPVPEGWVGEQVKKAAIVEALERAADEVEGYDTDPRQRGWRDGLLHAASIVRGVKWNRRSLFTWGRFTAASGRDLSWKIDCDFLTDEDWRTLALVVEPLIPPVREIVSIPTGGDEFARALRATGVVSNEPGKERLPRLVVDDVWTTGGSVARVYEPGDFVLVAFARGPIPTYVTAIWQLDAGFADNATSVPDGSGEPS